jgi:chromosome segregation ATPase
VLRGPSLEYVLERHPQLFKQRRQLPIATKDKASRQVDRSETSAESRLEIWMSLEEIAKATGITPAMLQYWDVTRKVSSRVVPDSAGSRRELLLSDVMQEIWSTIGESQEERGEAEPRVDLETDNEMLRHQVEVLQSERELVERRAGLAQAIADERQERIQEIAREAERVRAERDERAEAVARLMIERDELLEELTRLTDQRDHLSKDLEASSAEAQGLAATLQRLNEVRQELENELLEVKTGNSELREALEKSGEHRREMARDLDRTRAERVEALRRVDEAEAMSRALEHGLSEVKRVAETFLGPDQTDRS